MAWTWRMEDGAGTTLTEPVSPTHGSQADAESWLGEEWRELREAGVARVTLLDAGSKVYGPMSLSEE
jgi:hypothetical protein